MKNIPIDMRDFSWLRKDDDDFYYADKTHLLHKLVQRPMPYFLSRPRYFGKTLLLSTLKAILEGRRDLFKGLWIDGSDYHWTPHPVIKLEMRWIRSSSRMSFRKELNLYLDDVAEREKLELPVSSSSSPSAALRSLIELLYDKYGQKAAVLIDDYDAPIFKHLAEPALADEIRSELDEFYSSLKTNEDKLGLVFITGVTRFSKSSIFSGLNNLDDITFNPAFADICGFNCEEFSALFENRLDYTLKSLKGDKSIDAAVTGEQLKKVLQWWLDGYSWDGKTKVYNPWSVLHFFYTCRFFDYRFELREAAFLKKLIDLQPTVFDLSKKIAPMRSGDIQIDKIDQIDPASLLLQTGHLTVKEIASESEDESCFLLGVPNLEVKASLVTVLVSRQRPKKLGLAIEFSSQIMKALFAQDALGFEKAFSDYLTQYKCGSNASEKHYHALLRSALITADQYAQNDGTAGEEEYSVHLKSPAGDDYFIEVKCLSEKEQPETKAKPKSSEMTVSPKQLTEQEKPEYDKLRLEMAKLDKLANLVKKAITQIDIKYADMFLRGSNRVFKVALVVSDRTNVWVKIVEVLNR
ncbi:MAG: AAA family ATPase [Deltaproteobacteria bacterium]|jgi:hypothetical protein|nr:AAA family ATPase [Deltaproteobacteria bacterium]